MQNYDVVIVGAGPAGCQCARQLAKTGKKVLMVEKAKDFAVNCYSSGGAPLSTIKAFNLPENIISSYWNKLELHTSYESRDWNSTHPMGVIFDFMKLRLFLADDSSHHGAEVRLGCAYINHTQREDSTLVHLKSHKSHSHEVVETRVLVDATGSDRDVLAQNTYDKSKALVTTGIEYHVEVDAATYQRYSEKLSFFLGRRWMPQGYAWIFPIRPNQVKVGVIRYFLHEQIVPHEPSINHYLERLLHRCLGSSELPIIDKHGKTLYYTYRHGDLHFNKNIIAVGDAISTLNPLAAEGIRHAMTSGDIAAKQIVNFLEKKGDFRKYPKEMKRYYGLKWRLSEILMNRIYRQTDDHKLDLILKAFENFSFEQLLKLAFEYKLTEAIKFYVKYKYLCFR